MVEGVAKGQERKSRRKNWGFVKKWSRTCLEAFAKIENIHDALSSHRSAALRDGG
jgi:hypothetical protein